MGDVKRRRIDLWREGMGVAGRLGMSRAVGDVPSGWDGNCYCFWWIIVMLLAEFWAV